MNSARFVKCSVPFLIALNPLFAGEAFARAEFCDELKIKETLLLKRYDDLQKRLDQIDHEIDWLRKQKNNCDHDIQRVRQDLEQLCSLA